MLIGAMNHPAEDPIREIEWMAAMGLEFVDLTLEPPRSASWLVDPREIRSALQANGLEAVGHTAYYLPIASAIEGVRRAAVAELHRCVAAFAEVGVRWMNIHPDHRVPLHNREFIIHRNVQSLSELLPVARQHGIGLMVENLPTGFNRVAELAPILEALPELGFHLDIGHANLYVERNTTDEILTVFGPRVRHVHLHDNKGGEADLHLPLGAGTIDVARCVALLRASGYDGTITLEVFSPDRNHLAYSRDVLRRLWDAAPAPRSPFAAP